MADGPPSESESFDHGAPTTLELPSAGQEHWKYLGGSDADGRRAAVLDLCPLAALLHRHASGVLREHRQGRVGMCGGVLWMREGGWDGWHLDQGRRVHPSSFKNLYDEKCANCNLTFFRESQNAGRERFAKAPRKKFVQF